MGAAFLTYVKVDDGIGEREDVEDKESYPANTVDACRHSNHMQTCHLKSRLTLVVYAVCTRNPHSKLLQHVSTNLASEPGQSRQGLDQCLNLPTVATYGVITPDLTK